MESQRIVDYIAEQLRAGHSEETLRKHLVAHGWSPEAADLAFEQYARAHMPRPVQLAAPVRRHRVRIPRWTKARFVKLGIAGGVLVAAAAAAFVFWPEKIPQIEGPKALAYSQKQSIDVVLLAGAINDYTADHNGTTPTSLSLSSDGSLVLCGVVCDPSVATVSTLTAYKPENVKFMPYASGLSAPNKDIMYIVPGGACANANELGGQNTNPRAMVILYGRAEDSGLLQRCVTL